MEQIIKEFVTEDRKIANIYFANNHSLAPLLAYQVAFPRIEIILDGEQDMQWENNKGEYIEKTLYRNDILYIEANSWNKPHWSKPVTTLSILFGKQQLGISLLHWDGKHFIPTGQRNSPRRGPRVGTFIIQSLTELSLHTQQSHYNNATHSLNSPSYTADFLIKSLLSHTLDLLNFEVETSSRTTSLFEAIRQYIETHFKENLTREYLANVFYISPNYLSHLFHREGNIGLNEYLNQIRLEHSKSLLKRYDLNIKEVAQASGFNDSNYFCRVFKKKTDRSPTEYRRQYHSKLTKKPQ